MKSIRILCPTYAAQAVPLVASPMSHGPQRSLDVGPRIRQTSALLLDTTDRTADDAMGGAGIAPKVTHNQMSVVRGGVSGIRTWSPPV